MNKDGEATEAYTWYWMAKVDKEDGLVSDFLKCRVLTASLLEQKKTVKTLMEGQTQVSEVNRDLLFERASREKTVKDLVDVDILNVAEVITQLGRLYAKDEIYCYCGPNLILMNPYKRMERLMSKETKSEITEFLNEGRIGEAPAHIWSLSGIVWECMFKEGRAQSICISGESGSGKTEATKHCLQFLSGLRSALSSTVTSSIENKILETNPVLEAFGNARTKRNDNSSRFGKLIKLSIDRATRGIVNAQINTYLLEKSRVTNIEASDRNFHVFYGMLKFMSDDLKEKYFLKSGSRTHPLKYFVYLRSDADQESMDPFDQQMFEELCTSLVDLGFTDTEIDSIWRTLCSVLFLGNLEITEKLTSDSEFTIRKNHDFQCLAKLLKIDIDLLSSKLTNNELVVKNETMVVPLSIDKIKLNIQTFSRELYQRLFDFLVTKLNRTLGSSSFEEVDHLQINLLDIFGFEVFDNNTLEQLLINYANEKLQHLYIEYVFKNECRIFEEEGLGEFTKLIHFKDNEDIIDCIDSSKMPLGVMEILNQVSLLNQDLAVFKNNLTKYQGASPILTMNKFADNFFFSLRHTASNVKYNMENFIDKNKNTLTKTVLDTFELVDEGLRAVLSGNEKSLSTKDKFLAYRFKNNMSDLFDQLSKSHCHFVRCVKPNEEKKSDLWNLKFSLLQIQYMGVLDAIRFRRESFPYRFSLSDFVDHYQDFVNREVTESEVKGNAKGLVMDIVNKVSTDLGHQDVLFGKTRVFINEHFKKTLDEELYKVQLRKYQAVDTIARTLGRFSQNRRLVGFLLKFRASHQLTNFIFQNIDVRVQSFWFRNYLVKVNVIQRAVRTFLERRERQRIERHLVEVGRFRGLYTLAQNLEGLLRQHEGVVLTSRALNLKRIERKVSVAEFSLQYLMSRVMQELSVRFSIGLLKDLRPIIDGHHLRRANRLRLIEFEQCCLEKRELYSVVVIQKVLRGYLVRHKLSRLRKIATTIQRYVKSRWIRKYYLRIRSAALTLQRIFRLKQSNQMFVRDSLNSSVHYFSQIFSNATRLEQEMMFGRNTAEPRTSDEVVFNHIIEELDVTKSNTAKLVTFIIDLHAQMDLSTVYSGTWSRDYIHLHKTLAKRNERIIHYELGDSFTMAFTDNNEVYSWGTNDFNQLCASGPDSSFSWGLTRCNVISAMGTKSLKLGSDHGLFLSETNRLYSWGRNSNGQSGKGSFSPSTEFSEILIDQPIDSIHCKFNTNFILTKEGSVYGWPLKSLESLEGNSVERVRVTPSQIVFPDRVLVKNVSVGNEFSLFLSEFGLLYSMGRNCMGELGLGDKTPRNSPTLVETLASMQKRVALISAGFKHAAVVSTTGNIFVWGSNKSRQLGFPNVRCSTLPLELVVPNYESNRVKIRSVQAGFVSTFMLFNDRQVYYTGLVSNNKEPAYVPTLFTYKKIVRL